MKRAAFRPLDWTAPRAVACILAIEQLCCKTERLPDLGRGGADQRSSSRCSGIGSRAVYFKLEQLLERPGYGPFVGARSLAGSHLQAGVI